MIAPWPAIFLVLGTLACLVAIVRLVQSRFDWNPEISRKTVHMFMGLICLAFPWLFNEVWPVWILAGMAVAALGSIRLVSALRARFGSVLGGVQRKTWGELFFPVSVAFLFWLANGNTLLFRIPVLILAFADAVAALIGRRYGFAQYETDDGWKSIEGSASFFMAAFLSTHIPLLLFSNIGRLECLLTAIIVGFVLMLMEAIAWRGLDNLFVPLVCYVLLARLMGQTAYDLSMLLCVLLAIMPGLFLWRKARRLTQSALIGAALVLYVTWAVADWHWLIAPAMTACAYTLLCLRPAATPQKHTVHAIACIGGLGLAWLCFSGHMETVNVVYCYGVGYGVHLGVIAFAHYANRTRPGSTAVALCKSALLGYLPLAVPYLVVWRKNTNLIPLASGAFLIVALSIAVFAAWQPQLRPCPSDAERWTRQGIIATVASVIAFDLIVHLEPWSNSFF
ncbi:MAG: hypothetical protein WCD79_20100 [Chthoniobacteraceae bacterium]